MNAEVADFLEGVIVNHWDDQYAEELMEKYFPLELL